MLIYDVNYYFLEVLHYFSINILDGKLNYNQTIAYQMEWELLIRARGVKASDSDNVMFLLQRKNKQKV